MKKIFLFTIFLLFSLTMFAQLDKRKQVSPRINISGAPHVEFVKVADKMSLAAGFSITTTIKNKFYYGLYVTKKLQKNYANYGSGDAGNLKELDFSYQHFGLAIGGYVDLGIYRGEGGRYMKRKTRVTYSALIGEGVFWTHDKDNEKVSDREYFYLIQPSIGAIRSIGKYMDIEAGVRYSMAVRIDNDWEENYNLTNKEFSGFSVYLALRFNLFH